jgi:hypothetical protein
LAHLGIQGNNEGIWNVEVIEVWTGDGEMHSDTQGARVTDGAVIEIERDGDAVTALVLLAGDDLLILDTCDGSTPFVVRYDELGVFRVFEPDLLSQAA